MTIEFVQYKIIFYESFDQLFLKITSFFFTFNPLWIANPKRK